MKTSWVTIDRFCHEETEVNDDIRHDLERNGKPLRSSAESLSDDELLTKLRDLGVDGDRDGVERLCESISEFDDRFPLTQSLFNWSQDLETALYNAGRDNREMLRALIDFCEESLRTSAGPRNYCAAATWSRGSGTGPTSPSGCSTYARTPGGPAKPGGSVSRPGACGKGQPAHPPGRCRRPGIPREQ